MRRVVIVGGGVAGHLVALGLQGEAEVVLVDPRDHLEVPMAAPRLLVQPALAARALLPYAQFLPRVRHIAGHATVVAPGSVTVTTAEGAQTLEADVVVLATGVAYSSPLIVPSHGTSPTRHAELTSVAARLAGAERLLIVGGGPVGVELASEVAESLPHLRVTLAHAGEALLPGLPGAGEVARRWLERRGVEVRLGERVGGLSPEPGVAVAEGGAELPYDVAIPCLGGRPRTASLQEALPEALSARGLVRVRDTLEVVDGLFAAGDILDLPEMKLGKHAALHAAVIVRNARARLAGQAPTARYGAAPSPNVLVTLGRRAACGRIGPLPQVFVSFLGRWIKSRDMLVGRYRRRVGLR